jgi:hypothetical protein
MQAYIFKPTHVKEPTLPVLFFDGSGDIYSKKFSAEIVNRGMTFILIPAQDGASGAVDGSGEGDTGVVG